MKIPLVEKVGKQNDEIAALNRVDLRAAGVRCLNLMGSPGCGKTLLLEKTLEALRGELSIGVITGDLTTTRDAERIARHTKAVVQINTGGGCHLEAHQVRQGIGKLDLPSLDLLVIENVGNLICPVGFDLGQDVKVGMFSVPEGEDKPAKHPQLLLQAGLLLLSKVDLMPHVPFRLDVFLADLAAIRGDLPVLALSATTGQGLGAWLAWLRAFAAGPAI
ncbi:MAG: hydrogenase nickel incorporation protein HypB [Planctomycetes bacterium]|jgi:hydrogenase nickel incorporation protein HypB|nr:hydrogenase nickel incorporation protein HypB [Planctomycetota bacterium]